jgi:hypothetical protein
LSHHDTLKIWVGTKAFPVATTFGKLAERTGCWT